jgi:hypothetical protein
VLVLEGDPDELVADVHGVLIGELGRHLLEARRWTRDLVLVVEQRELQAVPVDDGLVVEEDPVGPLLLDDVGDVRVDVLLGQPEEGLRVAGALVVEGQVVGLELLEDAGPHLRRVASEALVGDPRVLLELGVELLDPRDAGGLADLAVLLGAGLEVERRRRLRRGSRLSPAVTAVATAAETTGREAGGRHHTAGFQEPPPSDTRVTT